ncbi:MAG: LOG family protein, partial [Candidatus Paceibacterota bacterium]
AKGAKKEGGIVIGVSPAETKKEHIVHYELPIDYHDIIMYTGHGYSGRNLLLTRMADAVVVGCGRMGTLNEFTIAFEDKKPIGVLEGIWETDEVIRTLIEKSYRAHEMKDKIIFANDPKTLISSVIEMIKAEENNGFK